MQCAWNELLAVLPLWMRQTVDRQCRENLQEVRLRLNQPPDLVMAAGAVALERRITEEDLRFTVNTASRYSPWAAATVAQGYLTAPGGHRLGLCGEAVTSGSGMTGIRTATSLCLRVARDFPGIGKKAAALSGNLLILGAPGSGKTTLLRDTVRQISDADCGSIAVVDERGEIFPMAGGRYCFPTGKHTDILTGCGKAWGIDAVLRTMGPGAIAVDEITAEADCKALVQAGWCGVRLLATAHAGGMKDLLTRPVYRALVETQLFDTVLALQPDKSWRLERGMQH